MSLTPDLSYAFEARRTVPRVAENLCYSWIEDKYKENGVSSNHLRNLANLGFRTRTGIDQGGNRAYFRLNPNPSATDRY
jgi:hypothetical protein